MRWLLTRCWPIFAVGLLAFLLTGSIMQKHYRGLFDRFCKITQTHENVGAMGMGMRIPQTLGIFKEFESRPEKLAFGFGMGRCLDTFVRIEGILFPAKEHNPHAGILQILYRLGIAGLCIALFYIFYFFRRALVYRRIAWTGGFLALILIIEVLGGGVLYSNSLLHTLCGGFLATEREMVNTL